MIQQEFVYQPLEGCPSCHGSSVCQRGNGELVASWFGGTCEGHPDTVIYIARKSRNSTKWQDARPVFGTAPGRPHGNTALFIEPWENSLVGERIWLFFVRSEGRHGPGWCLDSMTYYAQSLDGGYTWGEPRPLRVQLGLLIRNKPIRLRTGELALPAYSDRERNSVLCLYDRETDRWSFGRPIRVPRGCRGVIQPTLVAWPDGELQMYFRTQEGRVWRSRSFDDGRTWEVARPTPLPNPDSGIDALVLPNGLLVLVYNPTGPSQGRTPLVLRVSSDRGDSWGEPWVLEEGPGEYSYPCVILGADGLVHITYTYRRERIRHAWLSPALLS